MCVRACKDECEACQFGGIVDLPPPPPSPLAISLTGPHRGCDDGLASVIALLDHHLLRQEDLLSGDLHTQITTGNHDRIGLVQDGVKVLHTLLVLNLGVH